jgi:ribosome-binding protein aMBF1 (putative translation factor)
MITTAQLRAARALIDITVDDLAGTSGLSADAIRSVEAGAGSPDPEVGERLKRLFESKGVVFVAAGQQDASGAGVRLHTPLPDEGIKPQNLNATNDD